MLSHSPRFSASRFWTRACLGASRVVLPCSHESEASFRETHPVYTRRCIPGNKIKFPNLSLAPQTTASHELGHSHCENRDGLLSPFWGGSQSGLMKIHHFGLLYTSNALRGPHAGGSLPGSPGTLLSGTWHSHAQTSRLSAVCLFWCAINTHQDKMENSYKPKEKNTRVTQPPTDETRPWFKQAEAPLALP